MSDDSFYEKSNRDSGQYLPSLRELALDREFREFKEDTKDGFATIRGNTAATVRWLLGIVVVLVVTITGAAINARIQIEAISKQQAYQDRQAADQEQRIRYLEKYIGHGREGLP